MRRFKQILPHLAGERGRLRVERFWAKVDVKGATDCWEWKGSRDNNGYGTFKVAAGVYAKASRFALIQHSQSEPEGLLVCHRCDNPPCCNPAHLYFGTAKSNSNDMVLRGRWKPAGSRPPVVRKRRKAKQGEDIHPNLWVTPEEAAQILMVSTSTINNMVKRGDLGAAEYSSGDIRVPVLEVMP